MHALATLICYEVLDDIPCPSAGMKCCVESAQSVPNVTSTTTHAPTRRTTKAPTKRTTQTPIDRMDEDGNLFTILNLKTWCEFYLSNVS